MGIYDLPAAFKYIARTTSKKIHYIGHSQGTLIMFIALSRQLKDVTDNILSFHAFGPVAYMTHQSCKIFKTISKTSIPEFLEVINPNLESSYKKTAFFKQINQIEFVINMQSSPDYLQSISSFDLRNE